MVSSSSFIILNQLLLSVVLAVNFVCVLAVVGGSERGTLMLAPPSMPAVSLMRVVPADSEVVYAISPDSCVGDGSGDSGHAPRPGVSFDTPALPLPWHSFPNCAGLPSIANLRRQWRFARI